MAFLVAGTGWALLMALPGDHPPLVQPLLLALVTGAGAAGIAIGRRRSAAPLMHPVWSCSSCGTAFSTGGLPPAAGGF